MGDINRSINIYLNEAEVEASLGKLQKSAAKLEEQMGKAANPEEFKKLQTQFDATTGKIDTLSKQLSGELNPSMRQMEGAIAKARNELKNMATGTDEFNAKAKKLSEAEAQLKKVREEAFGVGKAITETGKGAGVFSMITDKIKGLASAIPGLGDALSTLGGPVLIVIGVFVGLAKVLMDFKPIADLVEQATEGIKAGFSALVNGGSIAEAATQAASLTAELQDLRDAEEDLAVETAKVEANVRRTIIASKDRGKTTEEQLALLKKAADQETELYNKSSLLKVQQVQKEEELFRVKKNLSGQELEILLGNWQQYDYLTKEKADALRKSIEARTTLTDEEMQKLREGRISVIKLEGQYLDLQEKISNRTSAIYEKQDAEKAKLDAKAQADHDKKIAADEATKKTLLAQQEQYLAKLDALETEFYLNERQKLEKSFDDKIALLKGNGPRESALRIAIEQDKQFALEKFDTDGQKKREEARKRELDEVAATKKKELDIIVDAMVAEEDAAKKSAEKSANDFHKTWTTILTATANAAVELIGGITSAFTAAGDRELAHEKKNSDAKKKSLDNLLSHKKISQESYNKQIAKIDAEYAEKERAQKKKAFIAEKAAKIVSTIISVAAGIAAQFQAGPAGIALAAIAAAMGAAQIAFIAAQPVPEFAKGGVARGASHAAGGISLVNSDGRKVGEMEGDEPYMILSRDTYRNNGRLIDALLDTSMNRGGARLDLGALPQQPRFNFGGVFENIKTARFASGGVFSNSGNNDAQQALMLQLIEVFRNQPPATVVYQDIVEKGNALNRASSRASFSRT